MQRIDAALEIEADGLVFTECPRWHDNSLYFSDIYGRRVYRLRSRGAPEIVAEFSDDPSGLGFLPNGDLLVVSMHDQKLLRVSGGRVSDYADLSTVANRGVNDMVVDRLGRAYVAQFGYDHAAGEAAVASPLVGVGADGRVRAVSSGLMVANGIVISPDAKTLICAESAGGRIAAFDIAEDGTLLDYRVFAQLPEGHFPDGICLDAEGGVWVACCLGPGVVRVVEGGAITHLVPMPEGRFAYACMLGGPGRRTLYISTAERYEPDYLLRVRTSRIESVPSPIPGAGLP